MIILAAYLGQQSVRGGNFVITRNVEEMERLIERQRLTATADERQAIIAANTSTFST